MLNMGKSGFNAGDWVEVRSKGEILRTLDGKGCLEGLPFMPEMFEFCGKRFQVFKRAHKTCDTVHKTGGRSMPNAVHLENLRCNGAAHGGCEADCLLYWKEAWLRIGPNTAEPSGSSSEETTGSDHRLNHQSGCSEADVLRATQDCGTADPGNPVFFCQATRIPEATRPLVWWDVRQYAEDYQSGNVGLCRMMATFTYAAYYRLANAGIGLGRILRWLYDRFQAVRGGVEYPRKTGRVPAGTKTPTARLDLQPGEWVRVRAYREILDTLDHGNRNRGLQFDAEMVPYCRGTYQVRKRVSRIIEERTGRMLHFNNDCIILEGVVCQSRYSEKRLFCPRSIYPYWREIWLERANG